MGWDEMGLWLLLSRCLFFCSSWAYLPGTLGLVWFGLHAFTLTFDFYQDRGITWN